MIVSALPDAHPARLITSWIAVLISGEVLNAAFVIVAVHTVFALRYARQYYTDSAGGINFHMKELPCYADFAYVSFGVGMSFQIADTDISTTPLRRTVVKHALLSYLFATIILAVTINLIASINA